MKIAILGTENSHAYAFANLVKNNAKYKDVEIVGVYGYDENANKKLVDEGVELVAVSLGGDGAVFVTKDQCIRGYSPKVAVVSTVGAGDAMMAALAHYSAAGCSLEEIARRAVAVATATENDKFKVRTAIAVAYAKACGERIPDFV